MSDMSASDIMTEAILRGLTVEERDAGAAVVLRKRSGQPTIVRARAAEVKFVAFGENAPSTFSARPRKVEIEVRVEDDSLRISTFDVQHQWHNMISNIRLRPVLHSGSGVQRHLRIENISHKESDQTSTLRSAVLYSVRTQSLSRRRTSFTRLL